MNPLVSVIIITRNRPEWLDRCIISLLKQDYSPFEIIVVDSSTNDLTKKVVERFFEVRYFSLKLKENTRPQSYNFGVKQAKGEIVVFIDDDVEVAKDWLNKLVSCYKDKDISGVGGRVIVPGELSFGVSSKKIGRIYRGRILGNFSCDFDKSFEVDTLQGCNMSFRKEVFLKIGFFDERFRFRYVKNYLTETDFCMRLRKAGYKLLFNPKAVVYHYAVARPNPNNLATRFELSMGDTFFFLKNFGFFSQQTPYFLFIDPVINTLRLLLGGSIRHCRLRNIRIKNTLLALAYLSGLFFGLFFYFKNRRNPRGLP
ncbi:MAG: glycosyltransferase family 2 protein [Candidatus Omnitrophica bacterium]|nr:glycosyltransferase family 2 protein [Candidatus Omnitrophota bacterium]